MNILILYASYSGGTMQAAQTINDILAAKGSTVSLKQVSEAKPEDIENAELILLGSPSWENEGQDGQPHADFFPFMKNYEGKIVEKKFAVFGLGDESYKHFCGAVDHLETFIKSVQGTLVQPSLRVNGFFFDLEGNTKKLQDWANTLG